MKLFIFALSVVFGALTFVGVREANAQSVINIDGSSTVFPITEGMAEEFQNTQKGKVRVTVGVSGTGGGFKKFCRGETDIQDASRPIQTAEMEICKKAGIKYIELPVAFDAIAIIVNPKNTWLKEITVEELKKMWEPEAQAKVMTWKQVNSKWPDQPLKLFGPGADNGTFDYFTEAVVGKSKASRGDYASSANHNTAAAGVSADKNGLAYTGLSYFEENKGKLKLIPVVGGDKSPMKTKAVVPSKETVENGSYYPLSRPIFIYVNEASLKKTEVQEFVKFYLKNAPTIVSQVKYIPLPAKIYEMALGHVGKKKVGTVFGGHSEIGLKIEELMKKEAVE